jgi:lysophospholipase L1-like esterase
MKRLRKTIPWLIGLLLLTSLAANGVLFRLAKQFYTRESAVRLQPAGQGPYPVSGDSTKPTLLLLGDSRIEQWKTFPFASWQVMNAGVGNETTAQILLRADDALAAAKPGIVLLQAGINDLKSVPLMPERQAQITSACVENLLELVQRSRARGARVILLSVLPAGRVAWARRLVWSGAVAEAVKEVNHQLAARTQGDAMVHFIDLTAYVQADDYVDTLHFNQAFYAKVLPLIAPAMTAAGRKPVAESP